MDPEIKKDEDAILKEANGLLKDPAKRRLLGNVLTLGGLSLATGIALNHYGSVKEILKAVSRFNDGAQGLIFNPNAMAPTYTEADIKEPFPFKTPTLDLSMVWLSHVDTDPAERWLRSRLEAFMSERPVLP